MKRRKAAALAVGTFAVLVILYGLITQENAGLGALLTFAAVALGAVLIVGGRQRTERRR